MEVKNNKTGVPLAHYKSIYKKLDPHAAAARCGAAFDGERGEFTLTLLGETACVAFPEFRAVRAGTGGDFPEAVSILLIRYISAGAFCRGTGRFLSYAEIPWGEVYLQNFNGRCIKRLAFGFGFDLERFEKACSALGGTPAGLGDSSFDLEFLEGFTLRVILWAADDEFPPNAQILFSDNFPLAFSAEDMAAVGDVLIDALKKAGK